MSPVIVYNVWCESVALNMPANLKNSAVATDPERVSFHSSPKDCSNYAQLHSFHMLARSCSKSSKLGFNSTWTNNFQMYKLGLIEKGQRNQRSNCQNPLDHRKSKRFQKNIYFCLIDYAKGFDCVDHSKLWNILKEMGINCINWPPYLPPEKPVCRSKSKT